MIKAIELRKGKTVMWEGQLCVVHDAQHVAKGNKRSHMQAKLKSIKTGSIMEVRFSVDDMLEVPYVESKEYEFLYRDGANFVIMDTESFDQLMVDEDVVGDCVKWLKPNEKVTCQLFDGRIVTFDMPFTVELTVTDCPPMIKGATATNQAKDATLETGTKIRVPPFVEIGTRVRVDTRTGEYLERAK